MSLYIKKYICKTSKSIIICIFIIIFVTGITNNLTQKDIIPSEALSMQSSSIFAMCNDKKDKLKCSTANPETYEGEITGPFIYPMSARGRCHHRQMLRNPGVKDLKLKDYGGRNNAKGLLAVILIMSKTTNFMQRQMIRNTWGHPSLVQSTKIVHVFIVAATTNQKSQENLRREATRFGDIVQVQIYESYENLTLKTLAGLNWAHIFCSETQWTFKTDDDVILNVFALHNYFTHQLSNANFYDGRKKTKVQYRMNFNDSIFCERINQGIMAYVNRDGIYKVPQKKYKETFFPPYCIGLGYAIPTARISSFLSLSQDPNGPPIINVEDAYITGVLGNRHLKLQLQKFHPSSLSIKGGQINDTIIKKFLRGERFVLEVSRELTDFTSYDILTMWTTLKSQNIPTPDSG